MLPGASGPLGTHALTAQAASLVPHPLLVPQQLAAKKGGKVAVLESAHVGAVQLVHLPHVDPQIRRGGGNVAARLHVARKNNLAARTVLFINVHSE